ncbi:MAG: Mrp/NBP35 family ATP-binding protein [Bacteroidales bacterium]|nr:Mrp/NBP35 family ATP-binding protein [Bacteroidales bacterium]
MTITEKQVNQALSHVDDPDLGQDLVSLKMIDNIVIDGNKVQFDLVLTTPACPMRNRMREDCINAIHQYISNDVEVQVNLKAKVRNIAPPSELTGVKNTILVASGKGGVGKSTVAANLAVALAKTGARVGLLDADFYGPSIPMMFRLSKVPIQGIERDGKTYMLPVVKYDVQLMSVGFMMEPDKALVWRGPMVSGALKQLATETAWNDVDYLVVDLPPGTGDVQLTVAQSLPVSGAVVVSTPQQVALSDVRRAVEMFRAEEINIPILGFVENMAYFTPAELPENKYYIFGKGGCRRLSEQMNIPLLGEIPLVQSIAEGGDNGEPAALDEKSPEGAAFMHIAGEVAKQLSLIQFNKKK